MSLRNKIFISVVFLALAVLLMGEVINANMSPRLLLIACSGELSYADDNRISSMKSEKKWIGDVSRGFFYLDDFFAIDNNKLIFSNIKTKKSGILADLQTIIDGKYKPWQVGYVDTKVIYLSAQRYEKELPINKQEYHSFIYRFDRASGEIIKVDLHECRSPYFSVHNDKIYFVNVNREICLLAEGKICRLGIKGDCPSVSPDGEKIGFASFGFINDHVYLYSLKDKNKVSLISVLGPRGVSPIIRWSKDNDFIAVKKESDLTSGPLYLINANSHKIVRKYEETHTCNWFFVDK